MSDLKAKLVAQATDYGFVACKVCRPDAVPEVPERLRAFLAAGYHGQMAWMADRTAWRSNPAALWPQARSVIMLAESYSPTHDPLAVLSQPERGAISVYAQGRDYHDVVKKRLKRLARWLMDEAKREQPEVKVFVDTAPVPEKALGAAAGLGWQGKHTIWSAEIGATGPFWVPFLRLWTLRQTRGRSITVDRVARALMYVRRMPFPHPTNWMRDGAFPI